MSIKEAQEVVDTWIRTYGVRYFSELTNMAVLTEEVGELARVIARKYGDQSFKSGEKDNLEEELADVNVGTDLHSKPNRSRPDFCLAKKHREEDKKRCYKT